MVPGYYQNEHSPAVKPIGDCISPMGLYGILDFTMRWAWEICASLNLILSSVISTCRFANEGPVKWWRSTMALNCMKLYNNSSRLLSLPLLLSCDAVRPSWLRSHFDVRILCPKKCLHPIRSIPSCNVCSLDDVGRILKAHSGVSAAALHF